MIRASRLPPITASTLTPMRIARLLIPAARNSSAIPELPARLAEVARERRALAAAQDSASQRVVVRAQRAVYGPEFATPLSCAALPVERLHFSVLAYSNRRWPVLQRAFPPLHAAVPSERLPEDFER
jgi:hypothetical protein